MWRSSGGESTKWIFFLWTNATRSPANVQTSIMERNSENRTTGISLFCLAGGVGTRVPVRQSDHQPCVDSRSGDTVFGTSKVVRFNFVWDRDDRWATLAGVWRGHCTRGRPLGEANSVPVADGSGQRRVGDGRRS